ncbi:ABC-type dipeptide/oligopeptide/nickel transport systems, permease components [[Clostridium] cf. saccharolyticum K10]|nr:ABC-type dipeptide/oligopeptide/nickel transport systems, permease components [[Clostridium] cf. saccharolyticum K10]
MVKYVIKRLLALIPVVIGVTFLVFMIMQLAPGDAAKLILGESATQEQVEELREEMGLNDPAIIQYGRYMVNFVQGDLGTSYSTKRPVAEEVFSRFPYTLNLSIVAGVISIILAIPLGILAAVKQNTWFDNISMIVSLIGVSMPIFWLALLLVLCFSLKLGWFPVQGAESWKSYILPAISLGFMNMAAIARTTRSSMLETIRQDYIRTARAKGVSKRQVIMKHAFKNALIPTITVCGIQLGQLLGGSVLTETVFAWPGIGRLLVQSINARDVPMVLGCIIVMTVCFSVVNLLIDLLYGFVDPRIRSMYS